MATFKTQKELEDAILKRCKIAVAQTEEFVYDIIKETLDKFYGEYMPSLYIRTEQILRSAVKTGVVSTGKGWKAEVYFDVGSLNHPTGNWSEPEILSTVMIGNAPHGGWEPAGGTPVWTTSINEISPKIFDEIKRNLIKAGIPVR